MNHSCGPTHSEDPTSELEICAQPSTWIPAEWVLVHRGLAKQCIALVLPQSLGCAGLVYITVAPKLCC